MLNGRRLHPRRTSRLRPEAQKCHEAGNPGLEAELDKKASAELSNRGTLALQDAMELGVCLELERLKECLAKIR